MRFCANFMAVAATAPNTSKSSLLEVGKMTPIEKVVNMLQNMQREVEEEGKQEKEMYQKMDCWCNTNNGQKNVAIKEAKKLVAELTASIDGLSATTSRLQSEIESLSESRDKNQVSLQKATEMRNKAKAEFDEEEADLSKAVDQLSRAIDTLKSNFGEFLQTKSVVSRHHLEQSLADSGHVLRDLASRFANAMEVDLDGLKEAFPLPGHMDSFAAESNEVREDSVDESSMDPTLFSGIVDTVGGKLGMVQQPAGYQSYNGKSGKILGILKQMLEGMTGDLKDARDHEANSVEVFEELKSAKTGEITSQTNSINEKTQELAEAQVNLANDKQNLEDTSADLELDEKFLAELKEKCATFDKQYAERSETRTQELAALSEAQKILSDDDARDAMSGLGKGVQSFIQTGASASARRAAAAVLRQASKGVKDSSILLTLSVATQIDSFGKVKEVLHKMKTKLGDEQKQEIEDKAECTEALNANNEEVQKVTYRRDDLDDKVTTLTAQVETLNEEIKALEQEINEAHVGIKKAGALRVEQSKAFKVAISDNIAAVKILGKVLDRLNEFYAPKTELLTQPEAAYNDGRAGRASSDAPEEFKKEYSGSQRSGGVLAMISKIIDDAEKEHDEMVSDEQTAQADYEQLVSDSFDAIKKSQRSVIDRQEQRAQAESDLTSSKEDLQSTDENLERLDKTGKDYHRQCDYILDHFDEMQKERIIEMEAIDMAVSMLSGMA